MLPPDGEYQGTDEHREKRICTVDDICREKFRNVAEIREAYFLQVVVDGEGEVRPLQSALAIFLHSVSRLASCA